MGMQIENLSQLQHKLRILPESVTQAAVEEIQHTGLRIRDRARENVRDSEIRPTIKKRSMAGGLDARIRPNHWRAKFEEFGTKTHVIKNRPSGGKKVLAGDGFGPVRGPVRHPGQSARPFMQPAAESERRDFPRRLAVAINGATRRVARS